MTLTKSQGDNSLHMPRLYIYVYIYIYVYKKTWEQPCLGPHMTEAVERTAAYKVQLLRSTTSSIAQTKM